MFKVSIIIPLHNSVNTIKETIQSCLKQTYQNIEVVVIENGSNDGSLAMVREINDSRIKTFDIGKASATIARNFGFTKATGEYIQYLDADDLLDKNKISHQMQLLECLDKNSIVSGQWLKFKNDIEGVIASPQKIWKDYDNPIQWLVDSWTGGGMMQTACWLAHRSLIESAGMWNEELYQNPNDDGEFFCRVLLKASKIRYVKESKVYYRIPSSSNVSENRSPEAVSSLLKTYHSYQKEIFKYSESDDVKMALAFNYRRFIYEFHPNYPDLLNEAENEINKLNLSRLPLTGGHFFIKLAGFIGFNKALHVRALLNKVTSILG